MSEKMHEKSRQGHRKLHDCDRQYEWSQTKNKQMFNALMGSLNGHRPAPTLSGTILTCLPLAHMMHLAKSYHGLPLGEETRNCPAWETLKMRLLQSHLLGEWSERKNLG